MTSRALLYWVICSLFAVFVAQAADQGGVLMDDLPWTVPHDLSAKPLPVPEPHRVMMLFAGIMAMAFTYRRAWMNWKAGPEA